ncbi:MAG: hypothetical protein AUG49_15695 [Catenulispora sp. 13_1_20CM_3_70_7]|nr:MAG: hypothetical protein AUG49_15695 [Catenulispora sp. 13_1_20CM_3_70_7]
MIDSIRSLLPALGAAEIRAAQEHVAIMAGSRFHATAALGTALYDLLNEELARRTVNRSIERAHWDTIVADLRDAHSSTTITVDDPRFEWDT